jgi:uncharacterized membrane protein
MALLDLIFDPDILAFGVLVICITITFVSRRAAGKRVPKNEDKQTEPDEAKYSHLFVHAARLKEAESSQNAKSMRRAYRKNWAEKILSAKAYPEAREIVRNMIMTNTAVLSSVLISFGLLLSGFSVLSQAGGTYAALKMVSISTLLIYSLFMLISECRILNYIPIFIWVDSEIISTMQKEGKSDYLASLMDDSFDRFSDSLRAIFYAVVCIFWFFYTPAFMIGTVVLTIIIVASDLDRTVRVTIF